MLTAVLHCHQLYVSVRDGHRYFTSMDALLVDDTICIKYTESWESLTFYYHSGHLEVEDYFYLSCQTWTTHFRSKLQWMMRWSLFFCCFLPFYSEAIKDLKIRGRSLNGIRAFTMTIPFLVLSEFSFEEGE